MFFSALRFSKCPKTNNNCFSIFSTQRVFSTPVSHGILPKSQITGIPTIEELRRKHTAVKNAADFKKTMANPDRIIGRAYAELEEERRMKREYLRKTGRLTQKDIDEEDAEIAEKESLGLAPNQSRWGEFLKKKKFVPKKHPGMAEIRMGVSLQSALDKVKHKKAMAKQRKLGKGGKAKKK
jgi:hypothetical protein